MKKFIVTPEEQITEEIKKHSAKDKRETTAGKTKIRQGHVKIIKKYFPSVISVLCIGCRDDSEVKDFIKAGFKCKGIDVANESKYIKKLDAHKIATEFEENEFDLVYASHSLEHMYDIETILKGIKFISKTGVFIVLPKGGMRNGSDPAEANINHPAIFDVMVDNQIRDDNLSDFAILEPYKIKHRKLNKRDLEMAFKWSK